ncbi:hypothetical protein F5Y18DRAFT_41419 [Xylariaceae sp. FL1019]|nr:hypothetical protein F5Y18DRAFT_41419 [Xylariaceae sp. FL1019]
MTEEHAVTDTDRVRPEDVSSPDASSESNTHDATVPQPSEPRQHQQPIDEDAPPPPLPQRPTAAHGQPMPMPQPYYPQQYQMPAAPFMFPPNQHFTYATPTRQIPKLSQAWIGTRIGLTVLSSILGIIIIALTSQLLGQGSWVAATELYAYPIAVASVLWNTAELITYCVRLRKHHQRGIHPGAHVALHLLLWLAGVFGVLLTVSLLLGVQSELDYCENYYDNQGYQSSSCDEFTPYTYYRSMIFPIIQGLLAVFALWLVVHFTLFVLACIETHRRNVMLPTAILVPISQPGVAPMQYYPQQGAVPIQYYQQPVMPMPAQAYMPPGPVMANSGMRLPVANEKQPAQDHQNLTGFYGPGPETQPQFHARQAPSSSDPAGPSQV